MEAVHGIDVSWMSKHSSQNGVSKGKCIASFPEQSQQQIHFITNKERRD